MFNQSDLNILRAAKIANPFWFQAVLFCAKIMLPRRAKYSGTNHPYYNFFSVAEKQNETVFNVFQFYCNMKLARKEASTEDFADEGFKDTLADLANYALLFLGYLLGKIVKEDLENYTPPDLNAPPYPWPTVGVDFDGVLNKYSGWRGFFEHFAYREGAREGLQRLKDMGYYLVIVTVRPDIEESWQWLREYGLDGFFEDITNIKPPCVFIVDDRVFRFQGDWNEVVEFAEDPDPYWVEELKEETAGKII